MAVSAAERADFRLAIGPGLAQLVREIAAERDLGERELGAGSSLPRILRELPDELVGEAMDIVAEADGGPAVLACMSVAAPTELAVAARVRLEEVDDPPAAGGRLSVVDAWALGAETEPVVALTVLCEREGAKGAQAFSFVLEEQVSGGAIKDGFVTGLGAGHRIVKMLAGNVPDGAELTRVDAADAHARVVAAATQGARGGWAPTDDGMEAVRIFLRAAEEPDADALVQALELGESLEGRVAAQGPAGALVAAMRRDGVEIGDEEAVQAWIAAFNASSREERDAILGPALERNVPSSARPPKKRPARRAQKQARRRNRGR